jgi:hypothetical protein
MIKMSEQLDRRGAAAARGVAPPSLATVLGMLAAETTKNNGNSLLLGDKLLPWLLLALGGALFVGNVMAIVRPPGQARSGELKRAPVVRSATMAAVGLVAAVWALASLAS